MCGLSPSIGSVHKPWSALILSLALIGCLDMSAAPPGTTQESQVTTLLNLECTNARPTGFWPSALWLPSDVLVQDSVILQFTRAGSPNPPSCTLRTETLPFPEAPRIAGTDRLNDSTYSVLMYGQFPGLVQIGVSFNQSRVFAVDVLTASQRFASVAWGHTGAGRRTPENTALAVETAIAAGLAGSELDVRLSHDTIPVLIHDGTVDRTTRGTGLVESMTAAQLTALDAGSNFGAEFAGEPVPRLETVLQIAVQNHHQLLLDVKSQGLMPVADWARLIVQTVRAANAESLVTVLVGTPAFLKAARAASPTIGLAISLPYYQPTDAALAGQLDLDAILYLNPESLLQSDAVVGTTALQQAGFRIMASTTDRPTLADSILASVPVSAILTDYPPRVYRLRTIARRP
jgi:glycerophosphoryl diester phosphodiesterase